MSDIKNEHIDHILDTKGLYCPEPVMMMHNLVRDVDDKAIIKVIATDPSTQRDIPKFCQFLGHDLISQSSENDEFIYMIQINK
ncbi:MAG: sulfurtransferase TusA [Saccharospirillaceae bacterium]|nr:sulfurtransferase TusA [Pseudomonadales bacterium]NRB79340.1 sulfurtransferase TusA [Saccharospirillaceae bacterium]